MEELGVQSTYQHPLDNSESLVEALFYERERYDDL